MEELHEATLGKNDRPHEVFTGEPEEILNGVVDLSLLVRDDGQGSALFDPADAGGHPLCDCAGVATVGSLDLVDVPNGEPKGHFDAIDVVVDDAATGATVDPIDDAVQSEGNAIQQRALARTDVAEDAKETELSQGGEVDGDLLSVRVKPTEP
jgi:hypothetical protein